MRCRALKDRNVVWFKSYGLDLNDGILYKLILIQPATATTENVYEWRETSFTVAEPSGTATGTKYRRWNGKLYTGTGTTWTETTYYKTLPANCEEENALYFVSKSKHVDNNYSERQDGVVDSLTQRLYVIKGELWYQINYGIPLLDRSGNKSIFDYTVINIITSHPDVLSVENFNSYVQKNTYYFEGTINTKYGNITMKENL